SGCLPMCGHDTIGAVTYCLEEGLVIPRVEGRLAVETPAGRVDVEYAVSQGRVTQVRLFNVASYRHAAGVTLETAELGRLTVDVAYGGNFYVIVEPQAHWPGLEGMTASRLVALSPSLRAAAQAAVAPVHPEDERIRGVSHVMWCDAPLHPEADARNAVFYGDKGLDRSPCGTGTSARMAQLAARGQLSPGDTFVHESLIGTLYHCRVAGATTVGDFPAISPVIGGWAMITGYNTLFLDDRDPFVHGFQLT
ncbi:MAG: 4-hydroxyproline epimerase, partial [Candidatus Competibacterales bacterium]